MSDTDKCTTEPQPSNILAFYPWFISDTPLQFEGFDIIPLQFNENGELVEIPFDLTALDQQVINSVYKLSQFYFPSPSAANPIRGVSLVALPKGNISRTLLPTTLFESLKVVSSRLYCASIQNAGWGCAWRNYVNSRFFFLHAQPWMEGLSDFTLSNRRRDGETLVAGEIRINAPSNWRAISIDVDKVLLPSLQEAAQKIPRNAGKPELQISLDFCAAAGTDSQEVDLRTELLLMHVAFEKLFPRPQLERAKILTRLEKISSSLEQEGKDAIDSFWKDFMDRRNEIAHPTPGKSVVRADITLMFLATQFYHLCVKSVLNEYDSYQFTTYDRADVLALGQLCRADLNPLSVEQPGGNARCREVLDDLRNDLDRRQAIEKAIVLFCL